MTPPADRRDEPPVPAGAELLRVESESLPKGYRLNVNVSPFQPGVPVEPKFFTAEAAMKQLPIVDDLLPEELRATIHRLRGGAPTDAMELDGDVAPLSDLGLFAVEPEIDFYSQLESRIPSVERVVMPKFGGAAAQVTVGPSDSAASS